ncbi:hypothetical protein GN956_G6483 [Arapaima gigas]
MTYVSAVPLSASPLQRPVSMVTSELLRQRTLFCVERQKLMVRHRAGRRETDKEHISVRVSRSRSPAERSRTGGDPTSQRGSGGGSSPQSRLRGWNVCLSACPPFKHRDQFSAAVGAAVTMAL